MNNDAYFWAQEAGSPVYIMEKISLKYNILNK